MNTDNASTNLDISNKDEYFKSFVIVANWVYAKLGYYFQANNINPRLYLESISKTSNILGVENIRLLIAAATTPLLEFCQLAQDLEQQQNFESFNEKEDEDASQKIKELESSLLEFCHHFFLLITYLSNMSILNLKLPNNDLEEEFKDTNNTIDNKSIDQDSIPNQYYKGTDSRIPSNT